MSGKTKALILGGIVAVGLLSLLVFSSRNLARYKAEVCVSFNGMTQCRTAAGASEEYVVRAATSDACSTLASGVTQSMACEQAPPQAIHWIRKP
jgi:uncharacterized membrane protein